MRGRPFGLICYSRIVERHPFCLSLLTSLVFMQASLTFNNKNYQRSKCYGQKSIASLAPLRTVVKLVFFTVDYRFPPLLFPKEVDRVGICWPITHQSFRGRKSLCFQSTFLSFGTITDDGFQLELSECSSRSPLVFFLLSDGG